MTSLFKIAWPLSCVTQAAMYFVGTNLSTAMGSTTLLSNIVATV